MKKNIAFVVLLLLFAVLYFDGQKQTRELSAAVALNHKYEQKVDKLINLIRTLPEGQDTLMLLHQEYGWWYSNE